MPIKMKPASWVNEAHPFDVIERESYVGEETGETFVVDYDLDKEKIRIPFEIVANKITEAEMKGGSVKDILGPLNAEQEKAFLDILMCQTPAGGFEVYECDECGNKSFHYFSCKNRNCPICQTLDRKLWLDKLSGTIFTPSCFHIVATIPHMLNDLILANMKECLPALQKAVCESILELVEEPKFLGATPGLISYLHTCDQMMNTHFHFHNICTAGGLTSDKKLVFAKNTEYLMPVELLSGRVAAKATKALDELYKGGKLYLDNLKICHLQNPFEWADFKNQAYKKEWVSYIKPTMDGKNGDALLYLAKYIDRTAMTKERIISASYKEVRFKVRDKKGFYTQEATLTSTEFVRRFLRSYIPKGVVKVRYYGVFNNRHKKENLKIIREQLGASNPLTRRMLTSKYKEGTVMEVLRVEFGVDLTTCTCCKHGKLVRIDYVEGAFSQRYTNDNVMRRKKTKKTRKAS